MTRSRVVAGLLNPYFQIAFGAMTVTASELLMKVGAGDKPGTLAAFGFLALASKWTWLAILFYLISFASWIYVLRTIPLGVAYALINVVHVLIPVACWLFLREHISPQRWCGITLVMAGLVLIAKPVARAEEKL
jgi:multidrug transporter EmrE-like cation transporter